MHATPYVACHVKTMLHVARQVLYRANSVHRTAIQSTEYNALQRGKRDATLYNRTQLIASAWPSRTSKSLTNLYSCAQCDCTHHREAAVRH
jgi:hypothetical protein